MERKLAPDTVWREDGGGGTDPRLGRGDKAIGEARRKVRVQAGGRPSAEDESEDQGERLGWDVSQRGTRYLRGTCWRCRRR